MSHFDYGLGCGRNALGKYYALERCGSSGKQKSELAWRDASAKVVNYQALRLALESPAFGHGEDLMALAELCLGAVPKELKGAVLGEAMDNAIQSSSARAISWLVGKGVCDKAPSACGAQVSGYSSYDRGAWLVKFESWSGLAAQSSVEALRALEDCGVGAQERAGAFKRFAQGAESASDHFYEFHPWVRLMGVLSDQARGRAGKDRREAIAALGKLWEPKGQELEACKRALARLAVESCSASAASLMSSWKVPMDQAMGAKAFESLMGCLRAVSFFSRGKEDVRQHLEFPTALAKWLSVGGGPKGQAVFDALAADLEKALAAGPSSDAGGHAAAMSDFSLLAKRVKGWGAISPKAARGLSDRIAIQLASQDKSVKGSKGDEDLRGFVKEALNSLDALSMDLAPKKSAPKRI